MLYKVGVVYFRLLGTNGFHVKAENEWFTVGGSRCGQNLKYVKKLHARGTRLFFFIQPIKWLICDVVVAVPLAIS